MPDHLTPDERSRAMKRVKLKDGSLVRGLGARSCNPTILGVGVGLIADVTGGAGTRRGVAREESWN